MKVNFSSIIDGSARIPSSIGSQSKPVLIDKEQAEPTTPVTLPSKTPEQNKAMWEGASTSSVSADLI